MNTAAGKINPWPIAIVLYFVLFISGIVAWIAFAMRNDMELVRPDYYEQEIRYQQQIDRQNRAALLGDQLEVRFRPEQKTLTIGLPKTPGEESVTGEIHLYRPSDSRLDRHIPLALDRYNAQTVELGALQAGLWKVRLAWVSGGAEYYHDQKLILP